MRGEVEISEFFKATFYQYEGALCIRCSTTDRGAVWLFRVPEFDAEIIEEHFANSETVIYLKDFIEAQEAVDSFRTQAKRNYGEWVSEKYAQVRQ